MGRITRTELNQQTAKVLARVVAGERLVVTDRGTPIAEIVPALATRWEQLVASGAIAPPRRTGPLPFPLTADDQSTADILDDLRADRT